MATSFRLLFILLFSLSLTHAQDSASLAKSSAGSRAPTNYIIKPLDVLRVAVYQENDLNQEVRVSAEGAITLPLIGKIPIGGLTVSDAQTLITRKYDADYLVNPQVTVLVLSYQERRVHVHGQVNNPGPVLIPPEERMTLSQAISSARGLTRLANDSNIKIRREMPNGEIRVFEIDFKDILEDPKAKDVYVLDGDNIFVEERIF